MASSDSNYDCTLKTKSLGSNDETISEIMLERNYCCILVWSTAVSSGIKATIFMPIPDIKVTSTLLSVQVPPVILATVKQDRLLAVSSPLVPFTYT